MEHIKEEMRNGLKIRIFQDDNQDRPDTRGDNNLFLVGYHSDFWIEAPKINTGRKDQNGKDVFRRLFDKADLIKVYDPDPICPHCQSDASENADGSFTCDYCNEGTVIPAEDILRPGPDVFKPFHVFGLEAYIHGGVHLALRNCGNFPDRRWDVSYVGAVLVARSEWPEIENAEKAAEGLVDTWNEYLSGNVYGFQIEDANGQYIDSCWGFYGDYDAEGGALTEARGIVDRLTNNGKTDHTGQLLNALGA